jgi:hypothetical protein
MSTPLDEAKQCPKCKQPGELEDKAVAKNSDGSKVVNVYCRNPRCKWFNTPWLVQINADGTIPDPVDHTKRQKEYVGFEDHDRIAAQIKQALEADQAASLRSGEIKYRGR